MTTNSAQTLRDKAKELRITPESVAIDELVKSAGITEDEARVLVAQSLMEKDAILGLMDKGINYEDAVELVKAADVNIKDMLASGVTEDENEAATLLEKAAAYIEALEAEVDSGKSQISEFTGKLEKIAEVEGSMEASLSDIPEPLSNIAKSVAFTNKDLEELNKISPELLTKIATQSDEAWGLGSPSGRSRTDSDPLLDFLMS